MGKGALIFSISSLVCFFMPPIGLLQSIIALVLGILSYIEYKRIDSYAFWGIIISIIGFTVSFIFLIRYFAIIVLAFEKMYLSITNIFKF